MKHLYFCRHGESEMNVLMQYAGQVDTPLTDRGREQAALAGNHADTLGLDLVVSSPLVRALETAQIIAAEANYPVDKIITNQLFMERSYGSLAGKSYEVPQDWANYPDIETDDALMARVRAALDYLHTLDADTILVVSHGDFGTMLRTALEPKMTYAELPNAQIVQLI